MADAVAIAYAYVNRRERTVAEVRARLEKAECPVGEAESAVAELLEVGYLDDARYARVFIEDKRNLDSWGSERIRRTLLERGIDRDVVGAAFNAEGDVVGTELDRALEVLGRRYAVPSDDPRDRERAFGMLIRKGYDSDTAGDAVRTWIRHEHLGE